MTLASPVPSSRFSIFSITLYSPIPPLKLPLEAEIL
jgi:hypothetical protein